MSNSSTNTKRRRRSQGYRTTINPSKRHRDRLNSELDNLAKLLPFPEDVIARLDKLSVLRLSVSFLRSKNFFKGVVKNKDGASNTDGQSGQSLSTAGKQKVFSYLFNEIVDGFLIVITADAEIFYVSESVKSHLGYSQSQILHQILYNLVHDDDHEELRTCLEEINKSPKLVEIIDEENNVCREKTEDQDFKEKEFVIRMKSVLNTSSSDMYKPFKISGTIRKLDFMPDPSVKQYGLFAVCTPARTSCSMLEIRMKSTLFCSKNRLDLSFLDMDARGKEFFGYTKKDIFGRSSYVMVHRADLQHLRCKHTEIITVGKTTMATFRLLNKSNDWTWVCGYARVTYKGGRPDFVVTTNRLMCEEEGGAMLKIRDDEDCKALARMGFPRPVDQEEAMKLGFPIIDTGFMPPVTMGMDTDTHMPGGSNPGVGVQFQLQHAFSPASITHEGSRSQSQSTMNDDLLKGDPEELFDVSEELLQSSPENILGSPDDFSDTFDLSPESLVSTALEPNYPPSTGVRPGNEAPTTCASNSNRSTSVSTMSDASGVEPSMLSPHNFNRQQSNSSTSPCKSDAGLYQFREPSMPQRRQEMQLLTNTLNSLNVEVPPNVLVPNGNTSFIDELSTFQGYLNQQSSAQQQMTVRPSNSSSTPPSGNNLTDLSNASPQIRGGYAPYKGYDGSLSGGQYPPNTTCEYGRNDLKMKLASVGTSTITRSNGQTPVNGVGGVNGINGGRSPLQQAPRTSPPQYGQYTSNYSYVNMQTKQDKNRSAIHGMDLQGFGQLDQPPPNVAITSPEVSLQALRALKVNRTQGSPTYPFMNSLSPTMSLNPYPQDVSSAQVAMYSSQGQYMTVPSTGHAQQMIGMRSYPAQYMQREQQAVIRDGRPTGWM